MVNVDDVGYLDPSSVNGLKLYAYCGNNPIMCLLWTQGFSGNSGINGIPNGNYGSISGGGSVGSGKTRNLPALPNWTSHVSTALDLFSSFAGAIETSIWASTVAGRAFADFHYAAYGISQYDSLSNLNSPLGRAASFIGYGLIVADVGLDIYNSFQQGYSFGKGATSAGLTLGKDLLVMGVSSKVGGAVGAFAAAKLGGAIGAWAGPVGLIVGVGVGFAVGYVINEFGDLIIDKILGWFN